MHGKLKFTISFSCFGNINCVVCGRTYNINCVGEIFEIIYVKMRPSIGNLVLLWLDCYEGMGSNPTSAS